MSSTNSGTQRTRTRIAKIAFVDSGFFVKVRPRGAGAEGNAAGSISRRVAETDVFHKHDSPKCAAASNAPDTSAEHSDLHPHAHQHTAAARTRQADTPIAAPGYHEGRR